MKDDSVELPLIVDPEHHTSFDGRVIEMLPLRAGKVPVSGNSQRLVPGLNFDSQLLRRFSWPPAPVFLLAEDPFQAESVKGAHGDNAKLLHVEVDLEEAPRRLRVGDDPAALVRYGCDSPSDSVFDLVTQLLVKVANLFGRALERVKHVKGEHGLLIQRRRNRLVERADLGPKGGAAALVMNRGNEFLVVVLSPSGLLHPLNAVMQLLHNVVKSLLGQGLIGTDANVDAIERDLFMQGGFLVPLRVAAANLGLVIKIRLGELPAKEKAVEVHRTPVDAHIGAEVPGPAAGIRVILTLLGKFAVKGDRGCVRFTRHDMDVIAQAHRNGIEDPCASTPADAPSVMGASVVFVVLLAELFGLGPTFQGFSRIFGWGCHYQILLKRVPHL